MKRCLPPLSLVIRKMHIKATIQQFFNPFPGITKMKKTDKANFTKYTGRVVLEQPAASTAGGNVKQHDHFRKWFAGIF